MIKETIMKNRMMNTKELAEYLRINEKKVYALIIEKKLPATKITGKWIFLKELVDSWLEQSISGGTARSLSKDIMLITGSDDPLFSELGTMLHAQDTRVIPFYGKTGSLGGLSVLKGGNAHVSAAHLLDEASGEYNLPFIDAHLEDCRIAMVRFAIREQGILAARGNPKNIQSIRGFARKEVTCINRQEGSGTRKLFDMMLKQSGIKHQVIRGYGREVTTHLEVGLAILNGSADCGIGIKAIANALGIVFIPIKREHFDIIVPKEFFFLPQVQLMLEILKSRQFRNRARLLGGYDTAHSGMIIYDS
jgi:putative molybdopterin biosynthesis protein